MDDSVCSVGWAQHGSHLSVGTHLGKVQIWDAPKCRRIRTMDGHHLRVQTLAWSSSILSSGSRDKSILHHDVCGLKWSYDNRELASGGNDNKLFVWNQHSTKPILKYCEHTAAVKAIAWSPHLNGLLASGGSTADRCIHFWNTTTNSHLSCMDTGSQVCNLVWSKNVNELVSTHGYSQNQIIVWRYPTMSKLVTLTGHTFRVLYLSILLMGRLSLLERVMRCLDFGMSSLHQSLRARRDRLIPPVSVELTFVDAKPLDPKFLTCKFILTQVLFWALLKYSRRKFKPRMDRQSVNTCGTNVSVAEDHSPV